MESMFSGGAVAIVGIAIVYMVFMGRREKSPYDAQTQSQIMALRAHAEAKEKYALQGVERRAQKQADRRLGQRQAVKQTRMHARPGTLGR